MSVAFCEDLMGVTPAMGLLWVFALSERECKVSAVRLCQWAVSQLKMVLAEHYSGSPWQPWVICLFCAECGSYQASLGDSPNALLKAVREIDTDSLRVSGWTITDLPDTRDLCKFNQHAVDTGPRSPIRALLCSDVGHDNAATSTYEIVD